LQLSIQGSILNWYKNCLLNEKYKSKIHAVVLEKVVKTLKTEEAVAVVVAFRAAV